MQNPIIQMLNRGQDNPNAILRQLMNSNPQFAQFMRENQGKTPEQIAREHGIDINYLNQLMKK